MPNDESETTKIIDVLLVIMSLVLASGLSSDDTWRGALFYFGLFVFITSAVALRMFMFLSKGYDTNNCCYIMICGLLGFFMSISFPFVFAAYFYSKLYIYIHSIALFWCFVVVELVLTMYVSASLARSLKNNR